MKPTHPPHPGHLLQVAFLEPLGISPYRLAKDTKLAHQRVNDILNQRRSVSAETDLHLSRYFGQEPGYWLSKQMEYDLAQEIAKSGAAIAKKVSPLHVVPALSGAKGIRGRKKAAKH